MDLLMVSICFNIHWVHDPSRAQAGVVARGLAILLAPVAGYLGDVRGVAWLQFLGALMLAIAGGWNSLGPCFFF